MGRTKGSMGITRAEEQVIRIGLEKGRSRKDIAAYLGRTTDTVNKRIRIMIRNGDIKQLEMHLGPLDD